MKAAQRQFLVSCGSVRGYWASFDPGDGTTSEVTKVYDGGEVRPEVLTSPAEHADVTIGRPFDPDRDQPVVRQLRRQVGKLRDTLTVQPTDGDLAPRGEADVYPDAVLIGVTPPSSDASSGDPAELTLSFAVVEVA